MIIDAWHNDDERLGARAQAMIAAAQYGDTLPHVLAFRDHRRVSAKSSPCGWCETSPKLPGVVKALLPSLLQGRHHDTLEVRWNVGAESS